MKRCTRNTLCGVTICLVDSCHLNLIVKTFPFGLLVRGAAHRSSHTAFLRPTAQPLFLLYILYSSLRWLRLLIIARKNCGNLKFRSAGAMVGSHHNQTSFSSILTPPPVARQTSRDQSQLSGGCGFESRVECFFFWLRTVPGR